MENRIKNKNSSKTTKSKLSKKRIAPFLVYPTVYYDGYLLMKNKNKENKQTENTIHASINRPSSGKSENKKS